MANLKTPTFPNFMRAAFDTGQNMTELSGGELSAGWTFGQPDPKKFNYLLSKISRWTEYLGSNRESERLAYVGRGRQYATLADALGDLPTGADSPSPANRYKIKVDGGRFDPWTIETPYSGEEYRDVEWSEELGIFCAVGATGAGRVMTSKDGIHWEAQTAAALLYWTSISWSPALGLFAAVSLNGTGQRVMTSPDGITWTLRDTPKDNNWMCVRWVEDLYRFVAVSNTGTLDRVMTSSNGITWVLGSTPTDDSFSDLSWSPSIGLLVAVANGGAGGRVMTSPDSVTWTERTAAEAVGWRGVSWSPSLGLFAAVAYGGTAAIQVMTSPDGITWTSRTAAAALTWWGVEWIESLGRFVAVSDTGDSETDGGRVMTSQDGVTWEMSLTPSNIDYIGLRWCESLGVLVAVGDGGSYPLSPNISYSFDGLKWNLRPSLIVPSGVIIEGAGAEASTVCQPIKLLPGSELSDLTVYTEIQPGDSSEGYTVLAAENGSDLDPTNILRCSLKSIFYNFSSDGDKACLSVETKGGLRVEQTNIDFRGQAFNSTTRAIKFKYLYTQPQFFNSVSILCSEKNKIQTLASNYPTTGVGVESGGEDNAGDGLPISKILFSSSSVIKDQESFIKQTPLPHNFTSEIQGGGIRGEVAGLFMSHQYGGDINQGAQDVTSLTNFSGQCTSDKRFRFLKNLDLDSTDAYKYVRGSDLSGPGFGFLEFFGGCVLDDGRVFFAPYGYSGLTLLYDPIASNFTNVVSQPAVYSGFSGALVLPDGDVFVIPYQQTGRAYLFSVTDRAFYDALFAPPVGGFLDAVLVPERGFLPSYVFCVPQSVGSAAGTEYIFNWVLGFFEDALVQFPGTGLTEPFRGACMMPDGNIFLIPSEYAGNQYVFDTTARTFPAQTESVVNATPIRMYAGACMLPDGKIFVAPRQYSGTKLIFDPATGTWEDTAEATPWLPAEDPLLTDFGFKCCLTPEGKVYVASGGTESKKRIFDPATRTWEEVRYSPDTGSAAGVPVLLRDGRILEIPFFGAFRIIRTGASYPSHGLSKLDSLWS